MEYCTVEELNDRETYWIKTYKENGYSLYNLTDGGDGANGCKASEQTKRKMSEAQKEYYKTHEHPNKGKKMSEEFCEKVRKGRKGKSLLKKRIAVLQIDPITNDVINEFDSIQIAINETGVKHISCCVNGNRKTAGGFIWRKKTA